MMRYILMIVLFLMVSACRIDDSIPIDVERSTIYHGQTLESLYDNFGVPDKQAIDPYGIRLLYYTNQSIIRIGVNHRAYYCDFVVYTDEGIVIDWAFRGNRCRIEETEKEFYLD